MYSHSITSVYYLFLNGVYVICKLNIINIYKPLLLFQVRKVTVFCNLTKPNTNVCITAKGIY